MSCAPRAGRGARREGGGPGGAQRRHGAGRRRKEDAVAHGAGFIFHANVGDAVKKGQPLLTIHSDRPDTLPAVRERLLAAIRIGARPVAKPKMILHLVDKDGVRPWPH